LHAPPQSRREPAARGPAGHPQADEGGWRSGSPSCRSESVGLLRRRVPRRVPPKARAREGPRPNSWLALLMPPRSSQPPRLASAEPLGRCGDHGSSSYFLSHGGKGSRPFGTVSEFPARALPKSADAWLDALHQRLNAAVAAADGWPEDISADDALSRLLTLNSSARTFEARTRSGLKAAIARGARPGNPGVRERLM
jgi:hypothetical protein